MVSKYSTGIPILQPISTLDTSPLYTAVSKKQEQYDRGFLTVQSNLDSLAKTTDLVRKQDMDMFRQKMESKVEGLNSLGNVDLSDVKLTASLASDVSSIANDKQVKKAVVNTQQYRQYQSRLAKLKENPKMQAYYSPINEQYDVENHIMPWMNGSSDDLSLNSPTLFFDMNSELQKALKDVKATSTSTTDGMYIYNNKTVSEETLKQIAYDKISTDNRFQKQMDVNAWYDVKSKTPLQIAQRAITIKDSAIESLSERMRVVSNQMLLYQSQNKDVSDHKEFLQKAESSLMQMKKEKEDLLTGNVDVKQLALQNQRDGLLDFAGRQSWSDSKTTANPYGVLAAREEGTNKRFQATMQYNSQKDAMNFAIRKQEADAKMLTATGKLSNTQIQNGVGMLEAFGGTVTASSTGVLSNPDEDHIDKFKTEISNGYKRGDDLMRATVSKILSDNGYGKAANEVLKSPSINEVNKLIKSTVGFDAKGVQVRKLYNEVRQKYLDVKDGKDDGSYFISNPDAAKTMNQAQKEFMIAYDLENVYKKAEADALKSKGITKAQYDKIKLQDFKNEYNSYKANVLASSGGSGKVIPYNEWVKTKREEEFAKYDNPIRENLAITEAAKKVFYQITPNKDLMKTKEGDYSWGALTTGIMDTALIEEVKLTGQEGTFPLWGQQLGKLAEKNTDDLKDVEIENVLSVSNTGLAKVKFKKGDGNNAETVIGTVQLNPAQTALWVGNKNTDTRFSDMVKRAGTSGALNTTYKGIMIPYTIGYSELTDSFYATIRRGNNPRNIKENGEQYSAKRAEELEAAIEEKMQKIYQMLIENNIPKEKWVDMAADILSNTIKSDPKAYK